MPTVDNTVRIEKARERKPQNPIKTEAEKEIITKGDPMKFFIPGCENDPAKTEEWYKSIKDLAVSNFGWEILGTKVHSLAYIDKTGKHDNFDAEVGKVSNDNGERVFAILETAETFLICTPTSGVSEGTPMIVNKREVLGQSYFD